MEYNIKIDLMLMSIFSAYVRDMLGEDYKDVKAEDMPETICHAWVNCYDIIHGRLFLPGHYEPLKATCAEHMFMIAWDTWCDMYSEGAWAEEQRNAAENHYYGDAFVVLPFLEKWYEHYIDLAEAYGGELYI